MFKQDYNNIKSTHSVLFQIYFYMFQLGSSLTNVEQDIEGHGVNVDKKNPFFLQGDFENNDFEMAN